VTVRIASRRWWAALVLAAFIAAGAVWWFWRGRGPSLVKLIAHLPAGESTVVYLNVATLRRAHVLDAIAGRPELEEPDYKRFVEATGFNYRTDLDEVLAAFLPNEAYLLVRGRFDWARLERYVTANGGSCIERFCQLQASTPGRYLSFFPLTGSVMAFASSPNPWAAQALRETHPQSAANLPQGPVWISIPTSRLRASQRLPAGTRLLASALAGVDRVTLHAELAVDGLSAHLTADCDSESTALQIATRFREVTQLLRSLIQRENQQPNPRDLSAVLLSGEFGTEGRRMWGRWKIPWEFLRQIAQER